jgi:hypothetical protein
MFLLPSVAIGVLFAALLGGRPSRVLAVSFAHAWAVVVALGVQAVIFSPVGAGALQAPLHLTSYGLLFLFAVANIRNLALFPISLGMALNAIAIVANGGDMPVSPSAWEATGLGAVAENNVRVGGEHLAFLGDVFALPEAFPLTNVFSVGDILIGIGTVAFIVTVATGDGAGRALAPARFARPFRAASFRRLALGKLVSQLGDWLTVAALVGWVYEETQSIAHVAVVMLVRLVPPILGGGLAAAVVDRFPRERLLVWIELARGAIVAGALAGVLLDLAPLAFLALAASGALAAVSAATVRALIPSVLDEEARAPGNAALAFAEDAAMAVGALLGGVILTASEAAVALTLDVATFGLAASIYWQLRARPDRARPAEERRGSVAAGIRYVASRRPLAVVVACFGVATIATGLTNATLPRFFDEGLALGPGAYGFALAALAGGLAVGGLVAGFARVGAGGGRWIGAAFLFASGLFVTLAYTEHAATALLLLACIGFLDGTTDVLFDTIVQREAHPAYYGRVFGLASASFTTTMLVAVAAAPLANRLAAPQTVVLVAAAALLLASFVALAGTRAKPAPRRAATGVGSPYPTQAT